ncbi:MAG: hypothetical protein JWR77_1897, partial [Rhizorhabdus sp.]|nr:hypothetical protein [Rhizorhabdus sp.]
MTFDVDTTAFDIGTGPLEASRDILEAGHITLDNYCAPERFALEREMFGRLWLNLAETAELPNAGDWVVRDIEIRSTSIILVRGKDMAIRAFHNICSHRGMKLVWDAKGRGGKFSCPYHAWLYDAQGDLTHIP